MEWLAWLSALSPWVLVFLLFVGRNWFLAKIEKGVQHGFDQQIESLRAEFRRNEEQFKSDLRAKEAEISALRDGVLSGRVQRQTLLTKRQMEAVERVWSTVNALAPYKAVSSSMSIIKFDAAAKEAPRNAKLRQFFEILLGPLASDDKVPENPAKNEQPFVSQLAWAYLSAYRTIIMGAFIRAKMLSLGIEDAGKLLDEEKPKKLLKAALPEFVEFIDQNDYTAYHYLLDVIEEKILAELKKILDGSESDQESLKLSSSIIQEIKEVQNDQKLKMEQAVEKKNG